MHGVDRGKVFITYLSISTIINGIISIFKELGIKTALAAPTGRAAQRITQTTGEEAKTIHRLLEYEFDIHDDSEGKMSFKRDQTYPLEEEAIVIDESSMIDIQLFSHLLDAISLGSRLVLVGDVDQLPSVGPGNVLSDLIKSGEIKTIYLTDIHRQKENSQISVNAHAVNNGQVPPIDNSSDFMLINKNDEQVALDTIIDLASSRMKKAFGYDPFNEIQVISPLKKGLLGTINLNSELQKKLNPPSPQKKERQYGTTIFREGDKVMQIKNNYNIKWKNPLTGSEGEGIYNGDIGTIIHMEKDGFLIRFTDGRESEYTYDQLNELNHAYAITVHKSQGSEFPAVIFPLMGGYPKFLNQKLLYTGITRAKEKLVLIGRKNYFENMISNNFQNDRNTLLDKRLKDFDNLDFNEVFDL